MKKTALLLMVVVTCAFGAVPEPLDTTVYGGQMALSGDAPAGWTRDLKEDTQVACRNIHRALYLIENRYARFPMYFGKGINFAVLYKHKEFYVKTLESRYRACTKTGVKLYRYGRCNTEQHTLAFVRVTLGFVHSTINLCDEFFDQSADKRRDTLVHEFGRLEDIGDATDRGRNNIYVWDAIVGRLADDRAFHELKKP